MININRLLDFVVCGGTICGARRWAQSLQDDDADLWNDLTLQSSIPEPKAPPVPKFVQFPTCHDDVSALCEPNFCSEDSKCGDDDRDKSFNLEFKDDSADTFENGYIFEKSKLQKPLTLPPLQEDCDGSSYSSYKGSISTRKMRHHTLSWQSESTEATLQTQNTVRIYLTVQ